ncbi:MAG: aspartyl/glutamyl-tRNA amidotransferase subunit C [Anaerolineales bacterium]|nr:aspartyl/glutamyl-tRNA amidotransferase subunit C [Anaerolineales bacterium]MDW8160805.1 aspartyl/glutamyl-tRNA amidotransferase subunit C [Anaerolineales bacterium]
MITPELFDHLVELAALELSPHEAEYLRRELNNQLRALQELVAVPLDPDIPPALHGINYPREIRPPLRNDEWIPSSHVETILKQAPELEERYVVVPEIPHQDLE